MRKSLLLAMLVFIVPSFAMAHVSVRPRDSQPGAEERYAVRVPTEGGAAGQTAGGDAAAIEAWLKGYDTAFMAKDLEKLATFYHPDVTIYEGGGIDGNWKIRHSPRQVAPPGLQRRFPRDWQDTMQHNQHTGHSDQSLPSARRMIRRH